MTHVRLHFHSLRLRGTALAAVAALALAGCGDDESGADTDALVEAGRTAEAAVDGARVTSVELDDGEWEVDLADADGVEHDVRVSADGTEVTRDPREDDTDEADRRENRDLLDAAQVDHEEAADVVSGEADGEVVELQLDDDRGTVVWEAEVEGGQEVRVDASTGEVL